MFRRHRAREVVLQALYQYDLNPDTQAPVAAFIGRRLKKDRSLVEFAYSLLDGVREHRDELDRQLRETAQNWSLERMAVTDRNILRLGAYELIHTDTPGRVVIDEAVELAKRYGDRQSSLFVNGILDRLLQKRKTERCEDGNTTLLLDTDLS